MSKLGIKMTRIVDYVGLPAAVLIAVFCELRAGGDPGVVLSVLGLLAIAIGAMAARRFRDAAAPAVEKRAEEADEAAKREAAFLSIVNKVAKLLQDHAIDHMKFADRLKGANDKLAALDATAPAAEILLTLIRDNKEMSNRIETLTESLAESKALVNQLQADLAKAEDLGLKDKLTEVGNRHFFDQALAAEMDKAREANLPLCLVIVDVDRFKRINDSHGHVVGDMLLKLIAELLKRNLKGQDKIARFGGEEFALLLPNTRLADAGVVANQIRKELEKKQWIVGRSGDHIRVTASFGIAEWDALDTRDSFVERADHALYQAKQGGRNRVDVAERGEARPEGAEPLAAKLAL